MTVVKVDYLRAHCKIINKEVLGKGKTYHLKYNSEIQFSHLGI